jgi:hypothetical protein
LFLNSINQRTLKNIDRTLSPGTDGFRATTNLGHISGAYPADDVIEHEIWYGDNLTDRL